MHFGRHHSGGDLSEERKRATDAYTRLTEYASQQGMVMLLELPHMHLVHHYNLTLTPGLGVVNFVHFGQALDQIDYQGDVTTEFECFDMPLDEIERQYDAGLSHLKKCGWTLADGK